MSQDQDEGEDRDRDREEDLERPRDSRRGPSVDDVLSQLEALEETVDDPDERKEVRRTMRLVDRLPGSDTISKFTRRDVAEAFVGSILISMPMLVEDGVNDIAAHFVATPALYLLNGVFVVLVTAGLLYYADFREVEVTRPVLGVVPRRLLAVLAISFLTAAFTMTLWGRLEGWSEPDVALARVSVVWTAASFGAALGDILPGESRGTDLTEELDTFGERLGIGDQEGRF